jgi:deoxyribonuclease V
LACHLGVVTGIPAIGVAKTPLGSFAPPGPARGATSPLVLDGEEVGVALRTRDGVKPVFVSVGHRIDLASACRIVLALANSFRLPEPTRLADQRCREALKARGTEP